MSDCRLIAPRTDYEPTHRGFVEEFVARGETIIPWIAAEPYVTFPDYVAKLEAAARGIDVPEGFVPHSTFWLVDANDEIVGISNLRHRLTDFLLKFGGHIGFGVRPSARRRGYATQLLRATLVEAQARGVSKVRVTCDQDNVASAKTILRNGGVLDDEELMPEQRRVVSRYWIDLGDDGR
jgi:predicted acetyltransferase